MPGRWPVPRIFQRIQQAGRIDTEEMYATFNMGIGMVVACRPSQVSAVLKLFRQWRVPAWPIGVIERT